MLSPGTIPRPRTPPCWSISWMSRPASHGRPPPSPGEHARKPSARSFDPDRIRSFGHTVRSRAPTASAFAPHVPSCPDPFLPEYSNLHASGRCCVVVYGVSWHGRIRHCAEALENYFLSSRFASSAKDKNQYQRRKLASAAGFLMLTQTST